jgi:hypothetical protein
MVASRRPVVDPGNRLLIAVAAKKTAAEKVTVHLKNSKGKNILDSPASYGAGVPVKAAISTSYGLLALPYAPLLAGRVPI